jgi:hypothetical protein
LRRDILAAHERLSVLRAEWAYLNRPDRLRDLAELNFDTLGLLPLDAEQFGNVDQVTYPVVDLLELATTIAVSGTMEVSE